MIKSRKVWVCELIVCITLKFVKLLHLSLYYSDSTEAVKLKVYEVV